jgi:hypothetical protein
MYAISTGDPEIVRLISALPGIDVELVDLDGKTALDYANAQWGKKAKEFLDLIDDTSMEDSPVEDDIPMEDRPIEDRPIAM